MMSTRREPVYVGAPPPGLSDWVITPVHFIGFGGLATTRGELVRSPEFSCFGHQWLLRLYPGGRDSSHDGFVAMFLENRSEEAIVVEFKFIVKHPNGGEETSKASSGKLETFSPAGSSIIDGVGPVKGFPHFALRSKLLNYLVEETLIVELHMRTNKPGQTVPFVPENPFVQNALSDFGNEETADVQFEVGGTVESALDGRNLIKKPTTTFNAHHYALRLNAPALADMCKPGDVAPTAITNVQPEIFKHLLYYCYGGKISKDDLESDAKDIIEAADRFGIASLKLEAEACYVDTVGLTLDSVLEVVTYADSKNLALLKERCMEFLSSADKMEVAKKVSFADMPPHLMKDLMVSLARSEAKTGKKGDLEMMCVSGLRKLAHEKGLDVDGSREMLIASIEGDQQDPS